MASRRSPTRVALTGSSKNSRGLALTTPCAPHMCRVVCVSQRICSYTYLCSALASAVTRPSACHLLFSASTVLSSTNAAQHSSRRSYATARTLSQPAPSLLVPCGGGARGLSLIHI